jgi:hypothetical protein
MVAADVSWRGESEVMASFNRLNRMAHAMGLKMPPKIPEEEVKSIKEHTEKVLLQGDTWMDPLQRFYFDRDTYNILVSTKYEPLTPEKSPYPKYLIALESGGVSDFEGDIICPLIRVEEVSDGDVKVSAYCFTCKGGAYVSGFITFWRRKGETFKQARERLKTRDVLSGLTLKPRNDERANKFEKVATAYLCNIVGNLLNLLASREVEIVEHKVTPEMECEAMERGRPLPKPYTDLKLGGKLKVYIDEARKHHGGRLDHAFWVRGFWKRLVSEHWVNKRGQIVWVHPHVRGTGVAAAKEYHVHQGGGA